MAEGAGFENRFVRKCDVGSNPTLSVIFRHVTYRPPLLISNEQVVSVRSDPCAEAEGYRSAPKSSCEKFAPRFDERAVEPHYGWGIEALTSGGAGQPLCPTKATAPLPGYTTGRLTGKFYQDDHNYLCRGRPGGFRHGCAGARVFRGGRVGRNSDFPGEPGLSRDERGTLRVGRGSGIILWVMVQVFLFKA